MGAPESILNQSPLSVNWQNPVNHLHPLNRGLRAWYLCQPGFMGGNKLHELVSRKAGDLDNMSPANWGNGGRSGGWGSISTNGTDEHVHLNHPPAANDADGENFAIAAWIKTTSTGAGEWMITESRTDTDQPIYGIVNNSGTAQGFARSMGGAGFINANVTSSYSISDGKWHFLQISALDGVLYLWADGIELGSGAYSSGATANGLNAASIGALHRTTVGSWAAVEADDIRFYNRGTTFAEHCELYRLSRQGYGGLLNRISLPRGYVSAGGGATTHEAAAAFGLSVANTHNPAAVLLGSITSALTAGQTAAAAAVFEAAAQFAASAGVAHAADASLQASVSHGLTVTHSLVGGQAIVASMAHGLQAGHSVVADISIEAAAGFGVSAGQGLTAQADFNAALSVSQQVGVNVVTTAVLAAGFSVAAITSLSIVGSLVSANVTTPAGRTLRVMAELRTLAIDPEIRTIKIN